MFLSRRKQKSPWYSLPPNVQLAHEEPCHSCSRAPEKVHVHQVTWSLKQPSEGKDSSLSPWYTWMRKPRLWHRPSHLSVYSNPRWQSWELTQILCLLIWKSLCYCALRHSSTVSTPSSFWPPAQMWVMISKPGSGFCFVLRRVGTESKVSEPSSPYLSPKPASSAGHLSGIPVLLPQWNTLGASWWQIQHWNPFIPHLHSSVFKNQGDSGD